MKKIIYIIILLINIVPCFCNNKFIDSLINKYSIKPGEILVIVFLEYGSCVNCILNPENIIKEVLDSTKIKIKTIGFINCLREKEIKGFSKLYNWNYFVEPDIKKSTRRKIRCDFSTDICFIDFKGIIIAQLSQIFESDDMKLLIEIIRSLE